MRIVLDTNILVSALISREGQPGRLLAAAKRGNCTLVKSAYQIEELRGVLGREHLKPYIQSAEVDDLLYNLESVGMVVAELPDVNLSPDPNGDLYSTSSRNRTTARLSAIPDRVYQGILPA